MTTHRKRFIFPFLICVSYLSISCFCRGPALSKKLIADSDLIFEGVLVDAVIIPRDELIDDLLLSFKVNKMYKGKNKDTIQLKSSLSSCGFQMELKKVEQNFGNTFLFYSNKAQGYYRYASCTNRRLSKTPVKSRYYEEYAQEEYKKEMIRYDSIYSAELKDLNDLLKSK